MCLIVLLLDAFDLHLPEHRGLRLGLAQITVVDDTWMCGSNKSSPKHKASQCV